MGIHSNLKTKKRNTVCEPEGIDLFKGLAWMVAGLIGISFVTTSATVIFP